MQRLWPLSLLWLWIEAPVCTVNWKRWGKVFFTGDVRTTICVFMLVVIPSLSDCSWLLRVLAGMGVSFAIFCCSSVAVGVVKSVFCVYLRQFSLFMVACIVLIHLQEPLNPTVFYPDTQLWFCPTSSQCSRLLSDQFICFLWVPTAVVFSDNFTNKTMSSTYME